jgi:hypothetical protein
MAPIRTSEVGTAVVALNTDPENTDLTLKICVDVFVRKVRTFCHHIIIE